MKTFKLSDYTRGWIVGSFDASLYNKDYEVGFKHYKAGDYEQPHYHLLSEELTAILYGEVEINGVKYIEGDIIVQQPGEAADFKVLSDRVITAVYRPDGSFPNDKYFK